LISRRSFLGGAATTLGAGMAGDAAAAAIRGVYMVSRLGAALVPEAPIVTHAKTLPPAPPPTGRPFHPVVTLNGWSAPWRMKDGWKEFHLVAGPVVREVAPGMKALLWGYNGSSPGPTIEVVEGDKVRIFVTNNLPEPTTIHWHGQRLPNGLDGVAGLNQPAIPVGKTFVYHFEAQRHGTYMYHPHANAMVQMAMGMMGFWVTHPKNPKEHLVERDYVFLLNAYDIDPGSFTPNVNTTLAHNLWTMNSRVYPGIDPLVCRQGDRVRIRIGNLSMTNHPIHLHGHEFKVTGTDGGWVPRASRWPEVTADIAAGQMRSIEFIAREPGDWAFHCHTSHHTMNATGRHVPNMIGVDQRKAANKIIKLIPDYMGMGERGMGERGKMHMPLPDNTVPMITGSGPLGPIAMGGMFTTVKVRRDQKPRDYRDPGWYKHAGWYRRPR
jgi:FtsP/CotA-like multicopper oxidase with cupredoxin domain